jgi:hypothetical protein
MTFCFIDTHVQELGGCMPLFWTQTSKHSQNVARLCVLWLGTNRRFMGTENILDLFRANAERERYPRTRSPA